MKRIVVITEEIALDSNTVVDAFVIDFGENKFTHEQLRAMLDLNRHQDLYLMDYQEGQLGIRRV
jgi:hypothetical protein